MTAPKFGDKETLAQLDPYRKFLQCGTVIPAEVLVCPFCQNQLAVTFDDYWVEGNELGAGTLEICCVQNGEWIPWWVLDDHWTNQEYYWVGQGYNQLVDKIVKWIQSVYPTFKNEF